MFNNLLKKRRVTALAARLGFFLLICHEGSCFDKLERHLNDRLVT